MKKRIFVTLLALVMALGLTVTAAAADTPEVNYIDPTKPADQQTQTCTNYTVVTGSTTWESGWYVVNSDVTINNHVTVNGDVKLILMDDKTLTVKGGRVDNNIYGIYLASGASLTVYGQSGGTGTLDVFKAGFDLNGSLEPNYSFGIALNSGRLTINGGHVMAGSQIPVGDGTYGLYGGTLIMNGGKLTANSYKSSDIEKNEPIEDINIQSACYKWRWSTDDEVSFTPSSTQPYTPAPPDPAKEQKYAEIVAGHEFGTWVDEVPATCTEPGTVAHKTCTICGKNFDANGVEITDLTIPATGHQFVGRTCTVCGYEQPGHEPIRRQHVTAVEDTADTNEAKTDVVASPKTFDAGVAVYGAMAIASLLGMGYVGKKRV